MNSTLTPQTEPAAALPSVGGRRSAVRLLIAFLLGALSVLTLVNVAKSLPLPELTVRDVVAELATHERTHPDAYDGTETYYLSPQASAHMHMIGRSQTCSLHIHQRSNEATVIVAGVAAVEQHFAKAGEIIVERGEYPAGWLIMSPRFAGHRWHNISASHDQGNLVFTIPSFEGNLFVSDTDPRFAQSHTPFRTSIADVVRDAGTSPTAFRDVAVPELGGKLHLVALRGEHRYEVERDHPLVLYVGLGAAVIERTQWSLRHPLGLRASVSSGQIAVIRSSGEFVVRASEATGLVVFHPEG